MKRVFVPTISGADCQRLLAKPKLHWKVRASAMTAAAAWDAAGDRLPREITTLFDATLDPALVNLRLLAAIPGMASRTSRRHYELVHGKALGAKMVGASLYRACLRFNRPRCTSAGAMATPNIAKRDYGDPRP